MTKVFLEKNYCTKNCDGLIQKECHKGIRTRCLAFEEREKLLKDFAEPKLVNGYTYEQLLETIENAKKTVTKEITNLQQENSELKELIKNIIRVTWVEGWNYNLDWKVKAEQFIKEIEK